MTSSSDVTGGRGETAVNGSSTLVKKTTAGVGKEKVNLVVRKSDEAEVEVLETGGDGSKKAVWNKAANGVKEAVMGADSWPALNEKGKGLQKGAAENDVPSLQGTTSAYVAGKQVTTNPHPNSIQSNAQPVRQKSFKQHGVNSSGNISSSTQPNSSTSPVSQSRSSSEPSNRNTSGSHKSLESGKKVAYEPQPHSHGTNDRPQHNNSQRKGTGPHQHGDGSYNHRHGARKDHDRNNRSWNNQGSFNGREIHPHPAGGVPTGVIRQIPMQHLYATPPLSPSMQPFGPVGFPEFPLYYVPVTHESIRGMGPHPTPAPHQMFIPFIDHELHSKVINQIDYYFSNENLVKDIYLRNNMDEEGWVPIELIAGFKQVKKLTNNIAFILEAIQTSTVVEVKDDKVRRRNDWYKWLIPKSIIVLSPTHQDPGSPGTFVVRDQKVNVVNENADIPSTSSLSGDTTL